MDDRQVQAIAKMLIDMAKHPSDIK